MSDALDPIEVTIEIDAPPSRVWRALTTPGEIVQWWAAGDVAAEVGHHFELDMGPFGLQPCVVLEVDSERLFRYRFTEAWELEWRLEPAGDGTELTMVHSGFDASNPMDVFAHTNMGAGWRDEMLPALRTFVTGD